MNIDRLNAGISLPSAGKLPVSGRIDLTISELGVTGLRPLPGSTHDRPTTLQVTSNRTLQAVLSSEETQALKDTFSISPLITPRAVPPMAGYQLQATRTRARTAPVVGELVDYSG